MQRTICTPKIISHPKSSIFGLCLHYDCIVYITMPGLTLDQLIGVDGVSQLRRRTKLPMQATAYRFKSATIETKLLFHSYISMTQSHFFLLSSDNGGIDLHTNPYRIPMFWPQIPVSPQPIWPQFSVAHCTPPLLAVFTRKWICSTHPNSGCICGGTGTPTKFLLVNVIFLHLSKYTVCCSHVHIFTNPGNELVPIPNQRISWIIMYAIN